MVALIVLNKPDYVYETWHGTLLTIGGAAATMCFNVFLARKLPLIEGVLVVIHIFGFFGVIVTMWVLSPTGDPKTVFVSCCLYSLHQRELPLRILTYFMADHIQ